MLSSIEQKLPPSSLFKKIRCLSKLLRKDIKRILTSILSTKHCNQRKNHLFYRLHTLETMFSKEMNYCTFVKVLRNQGCAFSSIKSCTSSYFRNIIMHQ